MAIVVQPDNFEASLAFAKICKHKLNNALEINPGLAATVLELTIELRKLEQLGGIHDALIRLESTLRMIGYEQQERNRPRDIGRAGTSRGDHDGGF